MKAIIFKILIFDHDGDKREVKLDAGLNIITGDSKTGKSALLEIVDYCFFSSRSTIPKGVVESFARLYVVVLKVSEKYLIIARPSSSTREGSRCYLQVETREELVERLTIDSFTGTESHPLKDVQSEVERHLGISVLDTRSDSDENRQSSGGKATLRSIVPWLFQHQNLIANKHSVFYRFDDFYKRKKTLEDFPILIGWANSEYFLLSRELEEKKKQLAAQNKLLKRLKLDSNEKVVRLKSVIGSYYALVGREIDENATLSELKNMARTLPDADAIAYTNSDLKLAIDKKGTQRQLLKDELVENERLLGILEGNSKLSYDSTSKLGFLKASNSVDTSSESAFCPVCHQQYDGLNEELEIIANSRSELLSELSKIHIYTEDNSQQIEQLRTTRNSLKRRITKLSAEVVTLESQDTEFQKSRSLRDIALRAKGATEEKIGMILSLDGDASAAIDIEELKDQINALKEKLEGFDLASITRDAESFLSEHMTRICNKLDFEDELRPGTLRFDIKDFNFYYHFKDEEKINLSEMGSGANWLACHLSLFLAFIRLNCKSTNSSIPAFLFIDQPSQVYFPTEYGKSDEGELKADENIIQVRNIFKVIVEELDSIEEEYDILPQVIVMEHADEPEFNRYVRKRWKKDGEKLI